MYNSIMKKIYLSGQRGKGMFSLVDDDDYERAIKHSWCLDYGAGYAMSRVNYKNVRLHRFVMGAKTGQIVDHINRDKLDNRKSNLRFVNTSINMMNTGLIKTNTSGYKGVSWNSKDKRWVAQVKQNYKNIRLGAFINKEDAIRARSAWDNNYADSI